MVFRSSASCSFCTEMPGFTSFATDEAGGISVRKVLQIYLRCDWCGGIVWKNEYLVRIIEKFLKFILKQILWVKTVWKTFSGQVRTSTKVAQLHWFSVQSYTLMGPFLCVHYNFLCLLTFKRLMPWSWNLAHFLSIVFSLILCKRFWYIFRSRVNHRFASKMGVFFFLISI